MCIRDSYLSTPRGNRNPVVHVDAGNTPLLYTRRVAAALLMASILAFQPTYRHLSRLRVVLSDE